MADKTVKNNFDNQVDNYLGFLQNEYATAAISLFLILYAAAIAPKLPASILKWFDNWIVQIALFFAIVYISNKNATVALIAAVAVLVTLMVANNQITLKNVSETVAAEKFCSACSGCDDDEDMDDVEGEDVSEMRGEMVPMNRRPGGRRPMMPGSMMPGMAEGEGEMMGEMRPRTAMGEVEGILDEHIAEHDDSVAGMEHAIIGGATTSRGGPKMPSKEEPDYPSHKRYAETEGEQMGRGGRRGRGGIAGVKQSDMEDETAGSSLDETRSMGSENASAEHNGMAPEQERGEEAEQEHVDEMEQEDHEDEQEASHEQESESSVSAAEEIVQASVEQVTSEVEHKTGVEVPAETQEAILSEVKQRVANLANRGKALGEFDVISVCREVYRRRY